MHDMTIDDVILIAIQAGGEKWIKTETGLQFAEKFAVLLIEKYKQDTSQK